MRILLVADTLLAGGAEWFILRKYDQLISRGHKVALVVLRPDLIDRRLLENFPGVNLLHAPVKKTSFLILLDRITNKIFGKTIFYNINSVNWLSNLIQYFNPDIIHSHLLAADFITVQANKNIGKKHIITIHGDYIEHIKKNDVPMFNNINSVLMQVNKVVVITQEQKTILVATYPAVAEKIEKIYNGYHFTGNVSIIGKEQKPFTFGMIARGIPEKGWQYAIDAFKELQFSNIRLLLYGESAYLNELLRNNKDDRIIFAGFTNKPIEAISNFDVGLFPSYYASESLPTTIIEYLMLHKPVITSDVGECKMMIEYNDQYAGKVISLIQNRPDVVLWQKEMETLVNDKNAYNRYSKIAELAKQKFNMQLCIDSYLTLYNN